MIVKIKPTVVLASYYARERDAHTTVYTTNPGEPHYLASPIRVNAAQFLGSGYSFMVVSMA